MTRGCVQQGACGARGACMAGACVGACVQERLISVSPMDTISLCLVSRGHHQMYVIPWVVTRERDSFKFHYRKRQNKQVL